VSRMSVCYFCGQPSKEIKKCPECHEKYCEMHFETSLHDCPLMPIQNPYEIDKIIQENDTPHKYEERVERLEDVDSEDQKEMNKKFIPTSDFTGYIECPNCGENVHKDNKECKKCGEKFDSNDWDLRAMFLFENGDTDAAIALAEKAVKLDPVNKEAWLHLGNYNRSPDKNNSNRTIECYEQVVKLDPSKESDLTRYELGKLYMKKDMQKNAVELFSKYAENDPDGFFEKVLELNAKDQQSWITFSNAFTEAGDKEKAKACFDESVRLDPKYKKETVIDLGGD
jgi:tetratricopeptide (TPR) repeat protein